MSAVDEVLDAFFAEVKSFADANSLTVAWPDVTFDAPETGNWLETRVLVDPTSDYATESGGATIQRGTFRVAVCGRPKRGVRQLYTLAKAVAANWPKAQVITGVTARIESTPSVSSPLENDDHTMVYVSIRWFDTL